MPTRLISLLVAAVLMLSLVGCSVGNSFDPHKHALTILNMKTAEDFDVHKEYILDHVADNLQEEISAFCNGNKASRGYDIVEKNAWIETKDGETHVMIESLVTTSVRGYMLLSYYTYKDNKLISYADTKVADTHSSMGEF